MDEEYLKRLGLSIARGVPQMATGFVDLAALPFTMTGLLDEKDVVGGTAYLTEKGLLPPPQEGVLNETAELVSGAMSPGGALKAGLLGLGTIASAKKAKGINKLNQLETPEFKNFFIDSKAVDSSGNPLVLYHGTRADIDEFRSSKIGAMGPGMYFTENPKVASEYADVTTRAGQEGKGNLVYPVYINAKNPLIIDSVNDSSEQLFKRFDPDGKLSDEQVIEKLIKQGYDSVYAKNDGEWVVFDPKQIKSAIGNKGTFNPNDPRIVYGIGAAGVGLGTAGLLTTEEEELY